MTKDEYGMVRNLEFSTSVLTLSGVVAVRRAYSQWQGFRLSTLE